MDPFYAQTIAACLMALGDDVAKEAAHTYRFQHRYRTDRAIADALDMVRLLPATY